MSILNRKQYEITLDGTIAVNIGGGVGLNGVLSVGGGGQGSLKPHYEIRFNADNYFRLRGSLGAYLKVVVAFIEYKKDWNTPEATLLEYPKPGVRMALMAVDDDLSGAADAFNVYDLSNYKLQDREYINRPSEFTANQPSARLFNYTKRVNTNVRTNIYPNSAPQLADFGDGTQLLVWVDEFINAG